MIKLEAKFVVTAWMLCFCRAHSDGGFPSPALIGECTRVCMKERPTGEQAKNSEPQVSCMTACLLKEKANLSSTTQPEIHSSSLKLPLKSTATVTLPTSTEDGYGCPGQSVFKRKPGEVIPGDVSDVTVSYAQETQENSKGWVAKVSWKAPKDVDNSSNWRGYLVTWVSKDLDPGYCKLLPKTQLHIYLNETDGWKYPDKIFLAVIAMPSEKESFQLAEFSPMSRGWAIPEPVDRKGHHFQLRSTEGIAVIIVAGLITGLALVLVLRACVFQRKSLSRYHVGLLCRPQKKAEKTVGAQKDQLII